MTISQRLLLLVGAAILSLVVVGGGGLIHVSRLNGHVTNMADNILPSIDTLHSIDGNFVRLRNGILQHTMSNEKERMASFETEISNTQQALDEGLKAYEKLAIDPENQKLLEASRVALKEYRDTAERVLKQSKSGDKETARQIISTDGAQAIEQVKTALGEQIKYNQKLATEARETAVESNRSAYTQSIGITVAALGAMLFLGIALRARILQPLKQMESAVLRITNNLDFAHRVEAHGNDEIALTLGGFNRLLDTLQKNFIQIRERSEEVRSASGRLNKTAADLSGSATRQSEAASTMAATVEEVTVSINHVSDRAREASKLSQESGETADSGAQVIRQTVDDINRIAGTVRESAERIGALRVQSNNISEVVKVIREIADQTNLLALNAAIEAARAGEQGRGFAVVADEVRKLAERTAHSTQEITSMITNIQQGTENAVADMTQVVAQVEEGVQRASEASSSIDAIRISAQEAVHMVSEITDAIHEQSAAMTNIAQQVERIALMVDENSVSANGAADSARSMDSVAVNLQQIVSSYRLN